MLLIFFKLLILFLQQQQLIELIRAKDIEKALDFAQTHLAERAEDGEQVCSIEMDWFTLVDNI